MCGIAGIWNSTATAPQERLRAMLDAMQHRGPDGRGTMAFEGGAGGMVRLALVDLSNRGQQPFWSSDGKVALLFNGEIYNFRSERQRLEGLGYTFRSTTDTEVILNLFLERGMALLDRLRGMYTIAIFDWRNTAPGKLPELTLARGPLGIKPLYLAHPGGNPNQVMFASELRGLLASGLVERQIDSAALVDFLSRGFVMQPRTMISGVRMLEPGWFERYTPGKPPHREQFWAIRPYEPRTESLDEAAERLRAVLEESVALHAMADAPVGSFLSGGIDSTGITALMRRHVADLHTYTLRFPDLGVPDESEEAESAACRLECRHTMVDITSPELAELLPAFAADIDQPSADGLNTWLISRAAARDVKGVLSGIGGDEWFAGYTVTRRMAHGFNTVKGRAQAMAGHAAELLANLMPDGQFRRRVDNLAARRTPLSTWMQGHTVFPYRLARRMASYQGDRNDQMRFVQLLAAKSPNLERETAVGLSCLLDTQAYMICQLLRDSDVTSMAHSLELRVPLVDLAVEEFSRTCDDCFKLDPTGGTSSHYRQSGSKRVLIHALRDLLPPGIMDRPKRGFALPYEIWMRGPLAPIIADTCSSATLAARGLVDPKFVEPVRRAAQAGDSGSYYPKLWSLMILELWCRAMLDRHVAKQPTSAACLPR